MTGMLINNMSLQLMFADLKELYNNEYLLTRKINQDYVEHFFGVIRGMGCADHPCPVMFKYRLKNYILSKKK